MTKFVKWLTQYNKFLVALTMALVYFLQDHYGVVLPVDEGTVTAFWMFISAVLVYAVPNTQPDNPDKEE
jgi:hypothetical protein